MIPVLAAGLLAATVVMGSVIVRGNLHAQPPQPPETAIPVHFTDVREAAGITFQHEATMSDEKEYLETMGNGLGWIDYDLDGYQGKILENKLGLRLFFHQLIDIGLRFLACRTFQIAKLDNGQGCVLGSM